MKTIKLSLFCEPARKASNRTVQLSRDLAEIGAPLREFDKEVMVLVTLNQKHQLIGTHLISMGTLTASLVHPREVFRPAVHDGAAAIALIHNHPSGSEYPSNEDNCLTRRLSACSILMGIRMLDHAIIGSGIYSYADNNSIYLVQDDPTRVIDALNSYAKAGIAAEGKA